MTYYSLSTGKLNKKTKIRKLSNLPCDFKTDFHKNWLDNVDSSFDSNFQQKIASES